MSTSATASISSPPSPQLPERFEPVPDFLTAAEPRLVWQRFNELRQIPRPSKAEQAAVRWVENWAADHEFQLRRDARGNLAVDVPASVGREKAPKVVLQAHLDMVCEKNSDTEFDFLKDPIRLLRDGDLITADGTTLGADNGIGVAGMMAMAEDPEVIHGPLELLFTLDEETGLNGVRDLDPALVTGDLLINLDTEDDHMLTVGSAGAQGVSLSFAVTREAEAPAALSLLRLRVTGATGGHSGADIHLGRVNANKVLGEILAALHYKAPGSAIVDLQGGSARNVIPRESEVLLWAEPRTAAAVVEKARGVMRQRYAATDPHLQIELLEEDSEAKPAPWTAETTEAILLLLRRLPNGRLKRSERFPELTQTSANLAVMHCGGETKQDGTVEEEGFHILYSCRSSVMEELFATTERIAIIARELGAEAEILASYPSWELPENSALLEICRREFQRILDQEPEVTAVHGGLECAVLGDKVPRLDVISLGPNIANPHSPDEWVSIASVEKVFQRLLPGLLDALSAES